MPGSADPPEMLLQVLEVLYTVIPLLDSLSMPYSHRVQSMQLIASIQPSLTTAFIQATINDNQPLPTGHIQLSVGQGTSIDTHLQQLYCMYSMHVCVPYRGKPVVTLSSVGGCGSSGQLQNGLHVI